MISEYLEICSKEFSLKSQDEKWRKDNFIFAYSELSVDSRISNNGVILYPN